MNRWLAAAIAIQAGRIGYIPISISPPKSPSKP